ncbi:aspartate ammonia-lyase [Mycolicibacterium frederiksbergense]|uniref:aspartate ammonia-lyase n=1 Tax=Mycolicibacterium frederiksbergense TaxID=117567 RepID=UPI002475D776|nr:aspartate ammonia-lyase [Mycolicibacterium frederiksbergense]
MAAPGVALTRIEHDLLGDLNVPADAYYGVHTARALRNFQITGTAISRYPHLVTSLATVKQAAAMANQQCELLNNERADAIAAACQRIRGGEYHAEFVVDPIQGGAGTSTNMNANEVIANIALVEYLGAHHGDYHILHPVEHVNLGQSTNDVYPTALKLAIHGMLGEYRAALERLSEAFAQKAVEFADLVKIGRTQLQDAVPMTLGQEFGAFALTLAEDLERITEARLLLCELNIGGTAIGTGLNTHPQYRALVLDAIRQLTGIPEIAGASDLIEATQDVGVFVQISGVIKRTATKVSKICNDLRLLSSGPRAGLNEINIPGVQAGSSMMPGKINPVIPEVVNQVAFAVIGNDVTITMAAEGGQLQLNAFEPIIARCLFENIATMRAALDSLTELCIRGISANPTRLQMYVSQSISLATLLNPIIGYTRATELATRALDNELDVLQLAVASNMISHDQAEQLLASLASRTAV